MNLPPPKVCQRIRALFAMVGSSNQNEANTARAKLTKLLAAHGLTWNDLPTILAASAGASSAPSATGPQASTDKPEVNVLDLVLRLIEDHIAITPAERMAVALWVLHTYVFDRFTITPRLVLLSPVRGCGKTRLLDLIALLAAEPFRAGDISAATIYRQIDFQPHTTLLVDELDGADLFRNNVLRTVFNLGHEKGWPVGRFVGGWPQQFPTFAPLAAAAIGTLPLTLMHRAPAIINMQRTSREVQLLDKDSPVFPAAREQIQRWVATCTLSRNPDMPSSLRNRAADNWRVLFAIADDLGHGEDARAAAVELSANRLDEDPGVVLLTDIRTLFLTHGVDRFPSKALVQALVELEDGLWSEWRGPRDDRPPRKLSQSELAAMLKPFGIRPRTIWPLHRQPGDRSARGYLLSQFEGAWDAYCSPADTPTHAGKIMRLPRHT